MKKHVRWLSNNELGGEIFRLEMRVVVAGDQPQSLAEKKKPPATGWQMVASRLAGGAGVTAVTSVEDPGRKPGRMGWAPGPPL